MVAITGKSGSGKSTLLHLIGGLDSASAGSVIYEINGRETDITYLNESMLSSFRRKNIGFVFQFFNLIEELTAKDNIIIATQIAGIPFDDGYYRELVEILGISDRMTHLPAELSGGEQQRVAIARALITKPAYLLLDEPTGNLDSESSDAVINMIIDLKSKLKNTVLIVTHDNDIAKRADSIITLRSGSLV